LAAEIMMFVGHNTIFVGEITTLAGATSIFQG
jgi:hypothetical protein